MKNRPAVTTAGTLLALGLLLGGKALTAPSPLVLGQGSSHLSAAASGTVSGPVVSTQYGPVQVRVAVSRGRITDVRAVQLPSEGRSGEIASYSAPLLRQEALAAQGAGIQAVSGATYTSRGYAQSLQAALDLLSNSSVARSSTSSGSA